MTDMTMTAHHWGESVSHLEAFKLSTRDAVITVDVEVPLTEAGEMLPRHGNCYWPTTMTLTLVEGHSIRLLVSDARTLSRALTEMADRCEAIDAEHVEPCGHWAPCGCGKKLGEGD